MIEEIGNYIEEDDLSIDLRQIYQEHGRAVLVSLLSMFGGSTVDFPQAQSMRNAIKRYIKSNQHKTVRVLGRNLGLSQRTIQRYMSELEAENQLKR